MKKKKIILGGHLSISEGFPQAVRKAESLGFTAMQLFTHSNRQWHIKPLSEKIAIEFRDTVAQSSIVSVIAHAGYLLNLAAPSEDIREKSVHTLSEEIIRCTQLDIPFLVLHPGARLTSSLQASLEQTARGINYALDKTAGSKTVVLLEIMAGQGSVIGNTFEQLAAIRELVEDKSRIAFCFDTCHAFAAGYNYTEPETYKALWQLIENTIGKNQIKVIHLNDSQKECGSRVDRHEHIGQGKIGLEAFKLIMNDPHMIDVPKILETPKEKGPEDYMPDIKILLNLLD
jgi:deoxyribonuclease IV